ncbi:4-oxalocrotonate decarboxylase [bacterium]|nr:4-oxalocrotonate decarboxylase [bacterium]
MTNDTLARILDKAALDAQPVAQLSLTHTFDENTAYAIQEELLACRYERGEQFVGIKLGFTSEAKMKQMGVNDLIWGRLTNRMLIENGGTLSLSDFCHPRVEPELCFLTKKDIDRELSLDEAHEYIEAVAPALEIIDSRYKDFKFSLEDVIADNCSSAAFVVGEWHDAVPDLSHLTIELIVNHKVVESDTSAAILGNPWLSVCHASRLAAKYGQEFPAGSYLMAGAATGAVYLQAGDLVKARVRLLGEAGFSVE